MHCIKITNTSPQSKAAYFLYAAAIVWLEIEKCKLFSNKGLSVICKILLSFFPTKMKISIGKHYFMAMGNNAAADDDDDVGFCCSLVFIQ